MIGNELLLFPCYLPKRSQRIPFFIFGNIIYGIISKSPLEKLLRILKRFTNRIVR